MEGLTCGWISTLSTAVVSDLGTVRVPSGDQSGLAVNTEQERAHMGQTNSAQYREQSSLYRTVGNPIHCILRALLVLICR